MAEYEIIPKATIDAIEESIQRKRGETAPISPSQMPLAIDTIPSSVDGTDVPVGGIYFTKPDSNGNPTECYIVGYKPATDYTWGRQLAGEYYPSLEKIEFIGCENIVFIGDSAFFRTSIKSIVLPDSVFEIKNQAFYLCERLKDVRLSKSTKRMTTAFYMCQALKSINLPNSLLNIDNVCFYGCTSLEDVTIEEGFNCNGLNLSASNRYTAETIVSWLEALADRTGQTTFTLTIGAANLNKLTAEQKAIATNKNWTLA